MKAREPFIWSNRAPKIDQELFKMKKIYLFLLCCAALALSAGKITVVIPGAASETEKTAALELQTFLKKTSNVTVAKEGAKTAGKVIYVGNTSFAKKNNALRKFDTEEWLIQGVDGNTLILNGGRRGVIYAAYEFLERFGNVMFLDQYTVHGPEKEPVWTGNCKLTGKPAFEWRALYSYFPRDNKGRHLWGMRSRQNFFLNEKLHPHMKAHGLTPYFGRPRANHTFYYYTCEWKNAPDEYFALSPRNGKRERATSPSGPGQICFTHPEVRRLFAAQLEKFIQQDMAEFKDDPPVCYAISANDNNYPCVCANCKAAAKKFGNYTGLVIDFVNYLGRSVAVKYPHVKLKFSAYLFAQNPPAAGTKLEKNIIPGIAQMGTEWEDFSSFSRTTRESLMPLTHPRNRKAFEEFKKWAVFGKLSIWDYFITWQNRGFLTDNIDAICSNLKFYNGRVEVMFGEIEDPLHTSFHPLRMYLIQRLWNDPTLDGAKELERFMTVYYGKAAAEMKAVRALIINENKTLNGTLVIPMTQRKNLSVQYFTRAEKLFNAALAKAGSDKVLVKKIKRERINFDRVRLMLPHIPADLAPGKSVVGKRLVEDFMLLAPEYLSGKRLQEELQKIKVSAQGPIYDTLPVKEFPGRKVIAHFKGNSFPAQYRAKIGKDADSATGTALYLADKYPLSKGVFFGYNDSVGKKAVRRTLTQKEFKFDGKYHWYRIGDVLLSPSCYVFAHYSWEMQRRLHEVYNSTPDNRADIYIKLKAELDPADKNKIAKLWMDGVLLLEPENGKGGFIKGFEGKKVVARFTDLRAQYKVKKVADRDSISGAALVREVNDPVARGIRVGYYDISSKKSWLRVFTARDFKFDGKYHWYSAGIVPVSKNGYAHVHVSTEFQQRLDTVAGLLPEGRGEVIFRLKAECDPSGKIIKKIYLDAIAVLGLPEIVKKELSGRKIITVYDANDIPALYKVKKTADKDAVAGIALVREVNDPVARGIRVAYFDRANQKNFSRSIAGKLFHADGKYHWYTLENAGISNNGYAHTHITNEFQRSLNELFKSFGCRKADLAFRIKTELDSSKKFIKKYYLDSIAVLESK